MDETSLIIQPVIILLVSLPFLLYLIKKKNMKIKPMYYVFFAIGIISIIGGYAKGNAPMEIVGMAFVGMFFMITGLSNFGKGKFFSDNMIRIVLGASLFFFIIIFWFLSGNF